MWGGLNSACWRFALRLTHLEGIKTNEKQHFIPDVIAGNAALRPNLHSAPLSPLTPHTSSASLNKNTGGMAVNALTFISAARSSARRHRFGGQTARGSLAPQERGGN